MAMGLSPCSAFNPDSILAQADVLERFMLNFNLHEAKAKRPEYIAAEAEFLQAA